MDNNSYGYDNTISNDVIYEMPEPIKEKLNVCALLSFIFGCFGVLTCLLSGLGFLTFLLPLIGTLIMLILRIPRMLALPLDIAGIILGIIARKKSNKCKWMSVVGIIFCVLDLLVSIAALILGILIAVFGVSLGFLSVLFDAYNLGAVLFL